MQRVRDWQPLTDDTLFRSRHFDAGLRIVRIDIEGQNLPEGGLLVFRRGDPPLFRIVLESPRAGGAPASFELRSLPNGRVELHTPDAAERP